MREQKHNPEQLKAYREAAVELHELSCSVEERFNAAAETGELCDAKTALAELQVRTEEFKKSSEALGPTGIFLAKYNVVVHDDHTVAFVVPRGTSRLEILQEAQGLVSGRDLIRPHELAQWAHDQKFTRKAERSERICIDGHIQFSDGMNRVEQERFLRDKNLSMPTLEDLAVAFAAHWIATNEPLFGWFKAHLYTYLVRAVGGALGFFNYGLVIFDLYDDRGRCDVTIAARLR